MKKNSLLIIITFFLIVIFQMGCSKTGQTNTTDWEKKIRSDFFSGNSSVESAISEAVAIEVKQNDAKLNVTVIAPDISDGLMNWMESISDEDFTEIALEEEILRQLESSEKIKSTYSITCTIEGNVEKIIYTSEFKNIMSCGLNQFYSDVTQRIIKELEVGN